MTVSRILKNVWVDKVRYLGFRSYDTNLWARNLRYRCKYGSTNIPIEWIIDNTNVNRRREIQNQNLLARSLSERQEIKKVMKEVSC